MKAVNRSVRKKDAMQLLTGQPVYTDDLAPKDCLVVKPPRSPHANAWGGADPNTAAGAAGPGGGGCVDLGARARGRAALYPGWSDLSGTKPPRPVGHRPPCPLCSGTW